jgi:hypothetical protein
MSRREDAFASIPYNDAYGMMNDTVLIGLSHPLGSAIVARPWLAVNASSTLSPCFLERLQIR